MEQVVIAPPEIAAAINGGDLASIKAWVAAGGDPNAKIDSSHAIREPPGSWYETLLNLATYFERPDICEFLLSRGARVDTTDAAEGCRLVGTPLCCAVQLSGVSGLAMLRLILSHGADPNLAKDLPHRSNCTPLIYAIDVHSYHAMTRHPDLLPCVRMLLRAGADPKAKAPRRELPDDFRTADSYARSYERQCTMRLRSGHGTDDDDVRARQFAEAASLLRGVRKAGSWARYFLRPHMSCMVLRVLCQRDRATFDHTTPTVLVYLFGAPPSRGCALWCGGKVPLRLLRHIDPRMPDLPDGVFWHVLTFMFGTAYDYPWVRPRLRARATASAAA